MGANENIIKNLDCESVRLLKYVVYDLISIYTSIFNSIVAISGG